MYNKRYITFLFHEVSTGALEILFEVQNQLRFKWGDLSQYLGIKSVKDNFKSLDWYFVVRKDAELKDGPIFPFGNGENLHDSFINLGGAIKIAVRSKETQSS